MEIQQATPSARTMPLVLSFVVFLKAHQVLPPTMTRPRTSRARPTNPAGRGRSPRKMMAHTTRKAGAVQRATDDKRPHLQRESAGQNEQGCKTYSAHD